MVMVSRMDEHETFDVVAIGASAGGVEALIRLAAGLSPGLPYAVLVVLHMSADAPSVLAQIIDRHGPLPAVSATHGTRLEPGTIYVGVPDRHLLVQDRHIVLGQGPTENGHRPAINALFRSVALACGPRAVSVVLSGVLDDGVLGSSAIRACDGITIAQLPSDALFPDMPANAVQAGVIDHQVAAADVGALLRRLTERVVKEADIEADPRLELENRIAMARPFSTEFNAEALGPPSGYSCPDCNGSLIAVSHGNYRCRVGHAWTADSLLRARDRETESALWAAVRSLQEKINLSQRLAQQVSSGVVQDRYLTQAHDAQRVMSALGARLSDVSAEPGHPNG